MYRKINTYFITMFQHVTTNEMKSLSYNGNFRENRKKRENKTKNNRFLKAFLRRFFAHNTLKIKKLRIYSNIINVMLRNFSENKWQGNPQYDISVSISDLISEFFILFSYIFSYIFNFLFFILARILTLVKVLV